MVCRGYPVNAYGLIYWNISCFLRQHWRSDITSDAKTRCLSWCLECDALLLSPGNLNDLEACKSIKATKSRQVFLTILVCLLTLWLWARNLGVHDHVNLASVHSLYSRSCIESCLLYLLAHKLMSSVSSKCKLISLSYFYFPTTAK